MIPSGSLAIARTISDSRDRVHDIEAFKEKRQSIEDK